MAASSIPAPASALAADLSARDASPGSGEAPAAFGIGELAREFDLTPRAIRFYEDCGLLAPSRGGAGGVQRVYTARDRTRLKLTLRGKRLGLSLAEIKQLVDMYESPRDTAAQLRCFLEVLATHRARIEAQLADLHATLDEVRAHEQEARRLLEADAAARPAAKSRPRRVA